MFEEGNGSPPTADHPMIDHDDEHSGICSIQSFEESNGFTAPLDDSDMQNPSEIPQIADQFTQDAVAPCIRTSKHSQKQITRYESYPATYEATIHRKKKVLMTAFRVEVIQLTEDAIVNSIADSDPNILFPPPQGIKQTIRFQNNKKKQGWLQATKERNKATHFFWYI